MGVDAPKDPEVSLINKTGPMLEAMHADPTGFMTVQLLLVATEMPAPDSVILMPALGPAGMDCMGVNDTVAVVSDAALLDARETVRFGISSSAWTGGARSANAANNMANACMGTRRHDVTTRRMMPHVFSVWVAPFQSRVLGIVEHACP